LRLLSDEVESLSQNNSRLLNELKFKNFYQEYNKVVQEVGFTPNELNIDIV